MGDDGLLHLAEEGISAEVIDLRWVRPLDMATIGGSVKKTGRCVVVHEAPKTCGFGAELSALIHENALSSLEAPVVRVTSMRLCATVSMITMSAFAATAVSTASKATDAGSWPSALGPTSWAPARLAQVATCSTAAARKVSAAPMTT